MRRNVSRSRSGFGKFVLIVIVLAIVIIAAEFSGATDRFIGLFDNTEEYVQPEVTTVTETVEVSEKENRIKAAQDAKRDEIEAAAQAAYDDAYNTAMTEVKAQVLIEMENELKAEREEAEKVIGTY